MSLDLAPAGATHNPRVHCPEEYGETTPDPTDFADSVRYLRHEWRTIVSGAGYTPKSAYCIHCRATNWVLYKDVQDAYD